MATSRVRRRLGNTTELNQDRKILRRLSFPEQEWRDERVRGDRLNENIIRVRIAGDKSENRTIEQPGRGGVVDVLIGMFPRLLVSAETYQRAQKYLAHVLIVAGIELKQATIRR